MPTPQLTATSPDGPKDVPNGFREWSRGIGDDGRGSAAMAGWPALSLSAPLLKVAAAAFLGYALGTILHGRTATIAPPAPPRPRPRPARHEASSIRFR